MFSRLFSETGLSLDRLRALLEVCAAGSIVKATGGDPVRQSQYSRQIRELEDFFRVKLIERQGKGTRATVSGKELARISRFFMLGLSNFQRGCLEEEQTFRIGASATFIHQFLLPALSRTSFKECDASYASEASLAKEIERRLHDLTLDFGVVTNASLSRPLQTTHLGDWNLQLWVPKSLRFSETKAAQAFEQRKLPLALAREMDHLQGLSPGDQSAHLVCDSFLEVSAAMQGQHLAGLLPDFLKISKSQRSFLRVPVPKIDSLVFHFYLAWNPRLLRLNPHAIRKRDWLANKLASK